MDCHECNRLWKEYQIASSQHLKISFELSAVNPDRSVEDFRALTLDAEAAEHIRIVARQELAEHEAKHHKGKAATQS